MHEFIIPAAKRVGTDLLEIGAPESAEVDSFRKIFRTAEKSGASYFLRKLLSGGSTKRTASRVNLTISSKHKSVAKRHFYKISALIMSSNFRYTVFVAVSGNLRRKVPVVNDGLSSHEQEIYAATSLD